MIVFDLRCEQGHQFESWFRSSSAYEEQVEAGLVECPYCGETSVEKAPMAPNVAAKSNQKTPDAPSPLAKPEPPAPVPSVGAAAGQSTELRAIAKQAADAMSKLQAHVEKNCENVGDKFAEEARKMHYGETEERGIYGESTPEEASELLDEGIDVLPLPGPSRTDA